MKGKEEQEDSRERKKSSRDGIGGEVWRKWEGLAC